MANKKAPKKKEKGTLALPFAMDRRTKEIVLLKASGVIQQGAIFYDKERHKGHLTCPKCELPDVYAIEANEFAGSRKTRRDHFARFPNQPHDEDCEWRYIEPEHGPPRQINYDKGGYFYLNTGRLPSRPPYFDQLRQASSKIPENFPLKLIPAWIKAISYEENKHGYDSIANDDFKDRPLLNGVSNVGSYLQLMKSIPSKKLKDTWVINRGVAVRLDQAILRVGTADFALRTDVQMREHKKAAGLKESFLMAVDARFDKFAALIDTERDQIKHPVLLHFKVTAKPKQETLKRRNRNGTPEIVENFWRVRLNSFNIENPERKKPQPHQLALPHVKVHPMVNIYDESIAKRMTIGQEFFAIVHPNLSSVDVETPNRTYFQHFNLMRPGDIIQMTQQELAAALKKSAEKRALREKKTAEAPIPAQSIPA